MDREISIIKLQQSQIDKITEMVGKEIWEEILKEQRRKDVEEAREIVDLLKTQIKNYIERFQTYLKALDSIDVDILDMADYPIERLDIVYGKVTEALRVNDIMIRELANLI